MPNMVELIKQAALEAVKESSPTSLIYGNVVSINPLKINIEQRLTLDSEHLLLTNNVRDHEISMTVNNCPSGDSSPKKCKIYNGLVVGDTVILIQMQGGQKFVVLDRLVSAS